MRLGLSWAFLGLNLRVSYLMNRCGNKEPRDGQTNGSCYFGSTDVSCCCGTTPGAFHICFPTSLVDTGRSVDVQKHWSSPLTGELQQEHAEPAVQEHRRRDFAAGELSETPRSRQCGYLANDIFRQHALCLKTVSCGVFKVWSFGQMKIKHQRLCEDTFQKMAC